MMWLFITITLLLGFIWLWYCHSRTISSLEKRPSTKYQAISINPCSHACTAVHILKDLRYLCNEAPRLPINMCTNIEKCTCKYTHHEDRRIEEQEDRRYSNEIITNSFSLKERRRSTRTNRRQVSMSTF
jgi:hypothetical protein